MDALCVGIVSKKVSYILDADIRVILRRNQLGMAGSLLESSDRRPPHHPVCTENLIRIDREVESRNVTRQ
jgi:hypothetical protein